MATFRVPIGIPGQARAVEDLGTTLHLLNGCTDAFLTEITPTVTDICTQRARFNHADPMWESLAASHQGSASQAVAAAVALIRLADYLDSPPNSITALVAAYGLPGTRDLRLLPMLLCAPTTIEVDAWTIDPPTLADLTMQGMRRGWAPLGFLIAEAGLTGWPWTPEATTVAAA